MEDTSALSLHTTGLINRKSQQKETTFKTTEQKPIEVFIFSFFFPHYTRKHYATRNDLH